MISPRTKFFLILVLQLVVLILDYPNTPNFTLPNASSFAPSHHQTPFNDHLLSNSKEAFQKLIEQCATDLDLRKRICADMNAKFNVTDVFLRIALEVLLVCDNNNDIVQNQDVIQHPT